MIKTKIDDLGSKINMLNVEQKNLSEKLSSIKEKNDNSLLSVSKFI